MMAPRRRWEASFSQEQPKVKMDLSAGSEMPPLDTNHKYRIRWKNVAWVIYLHYSAVYGSYLAFTAASRSLIIWQVFLGLVSTFGITMGAHRLFSHRCFRANRTLELLLVVAQTVAFQDSVIEWARNHRTHHKFTETDADPHNMKRGFFFAHIGWIMCDKHPAVKEKGRGIDISDLTGDPVLRFQHKYYKFLMPLSTFLLPSLLPALLWGDHLRTAWHLSMLRYCVNLHQACCINSFAHWVGHKPYDRHIAPADNVWTSLVSFGEGWHNYHHVFPWDYKTGEFTSRLLTASATTYVVDFCAWLGWAYDLKTVPESLVRDRCLRTGDGSHPVWGWGDKDMKPEVVDHVNGKAQLNGAGLGHAAEFASAL